MPGYIETDRRGTDCEELKLSDMVHIVVQWLALLTTLF